MQAIREPVPRRDRKAVADHTSVQQSLEHVPVSMIDGGNRIWQLFIVLMYGVYRCRAQHQTRGHVVEWLCSGLQIRVPQFNSGRGLQFSQIMAQQS